MSSEAAGEYRIQSKEISYIPKKPKELIGKSKNILDLGCGNGWLRTYLHQGQIYTGISFSKTEVDYINNTNYFSINTEAILHDARKELPFKKESFDCVTAIHFIEHFTKEDVESIMGEVRRVLKKGGWLILATPTDYQPFFWGEWSHVRPYNHGSIEGLLKDFGFKEVSWTYPKIEFLPQKWQALLRFPFFFLKPLLWGEVYAVGRI